MHIKNIHCMVEKLAECAKCEVEKGIEQLNTEEMGAVTDILKDLCEAEYYAREAKEMEKEEEDEKKENEYFLKMLKEEYGEEEGEKRFYSGQPRSRTSGRFMRRGDGRRRGYEEPPYYHMNPEMYKEHDPEWYRDMDRQTKGVMYFSPPMSGNMSGGNSSAGNGNSGNSSGNVRSYTEGFEDGQTRGYSEGYERGKSDGRNSQSRDRREGRSGQSRRGYMETKEKHSDNTPESKQAKMKSLEAYMKELSEDISEMIEGASNEEKTMLRSKVQTLAQKIQ